MSRFSHYAARVGVIVFLSLICVLRTYAQKKHALIVAIGNYPPESSWKTIHSLNDVPYVREALMQQEFPDSNIRILLDSQATKAGIVKALNELIEKTGKGDVVVFHFSGHGQRVADNNGDYDETTDGYDEAIVPYDALEYFTTDTAKNKNHLTDDEINILLTRLKKKAGKEGNILVLFDACYSGDGIKGHEDYVVRGSDIVFKPDNFIPQLNVSDKKTNDSFLDVVDSVSNLVFFSASSPYQKNREVRDDMNRPVGPLSYAFCLALSKISKHELSYEELFYMIEQQIQTWSCSRGVLQYPSYEGNLDQQVFAKQIVNLQKKIPVTRLINDTTVLLPRGRLFGVCSESTFTIFPLNSNNDALASGRIVDVSEGQAIGVVNKNLNKQDFYQVVFDSKGMGNMQVKLKMNLPLPAQRTIEEALEKYKYIEIIKDAKSNPDLIIEMVPGLSGSSGLVQMLYGNDSILWKKSYTADANPVNAADADQIRIKIQKYCRAQFLRNLPDGGEWADKVTAAIKPANASAAMKMNGSRPGSIPSFDTNDSISIVIKNNSNDRVYLGIIDITADHTVAVINPKTNSRGQSLKPVELIIYPDGEFETDRFGLSPPYGLEVIKIIISEEVLSQLKNLDTRDVGIKSIQKLTSFEEFYNETFKDGFGNTGTKSGTPPIAKAGIITLLFKLNELRKVTDPQ